MASVSQGLNSHRAVLDANFAKLTPEFHHPPSMSCSGSLMSSSDTQILWLFLEVLKTLLRSKHDLCASRWQHQCRWISKCRRSQEIPSERMAKWLEWVVYNLYWFIGLHYPKLPFRSYHSASLSLQLSLSWWLTLSLSAARCSTAPGFCCSEALADLAVRLVLNWRKPSKKKSTRYWDYLHGTPKRVDPVPWFLCISFRGKGLIAQPIRWS